MNRLLAWLVASAVVLAACGIPLDDRPEVISSEELPRVLRQQPTTTTTTSLPPQLTMRVTIYLVDPADGNPRLVPVTRQIPQTESIVELERRTLEHLLAGPTSEEQSAVNLTTLIVPSGDDPIVISAVRNPVAGQVDVVFSELPSIEGIGRVAQFAQIVFTATEIDGVDLVRFFVLAEDGGERAITVKTDTQEGDVDRPVGREDYSSLRPQRAPL